MTKHILCFAALVCSAVLVLSGCPNPASTETKDDTEYVAEVKAALSLELTQTMDASFSLPSSSNSEVNVVWASSNTELISINGNTATVTRLNNDTVVTLTATITKGSASDTKAFTVTVLGTTHIWTDTEVLNYAREKLALSANVTEDITLPASFNVDGNTVSISWGSDNEHISNTGVVSRDIVDVNVTLTATLTYESKTTEKSFTVIVLRLSEIVYENEYMKRSWTFDGTTAVYEYYDYEESETVPEYKKTFTYTVDQPNSTIRASLRTITEDGTDYTKQEYIDFLVELRMAVMGLYSSIYEEVAAASSISKDQTITYMRSILEISGISTSSLSDTEIIEECYDMFGFESVEDFNAYTNYKSAIEAYFIDMIAMLEQMTGQTFDSFSEAIAAYEDMLEADVIVEVAHEFYADVLFEYTISHYEDDYYFYTEAIFDDNKEWYEQYGTYYGSAETGGDYIYLELDALNNEFYFDDDGFGIEFNSTFTQFTTQEDETWNLSFDSSDNTLDINDGTNTYTLEFDPYNMLGRQVE